MVPRDSQDALGFAPATRRDTQQPILCGLVFVGVAFKRDVAADQDGVDRNSVPVAESKQVCFEASSKWSVTIPSRS